MPEFVDVAFLESTDDDDLVSLGEMLERIDLLRRRIYSFGHGAERVRRAP
jgi:hypothetical protein